MLHVGRGDYSSKLSTFKANAPGSITLHDFKDEFRRKANNQGSKTAENILFGNFDVDVLTATAEEIHPSSTTLSCGLLFVTRTARGPTS